MSQTTNTSAVADARSVLTDPNATAGALRESLRAVLAYVSAEDERTQEARIALWAALGDVDA